MKKPKWVVEKERLRKFEKDESFLLFGIHAVGDALINPSRKKLRLIVTKNARDKLASAIDVSGVNPEICEPKALNSLGNIAVLAIMGSAIAVIIFHKLIKMTEPLFATSCTYIIPIIAIIWGISDNEIITKHHIIGFVIILGGVYLVNKRT